MGYQGLLAQQLGDVEEGLGNRGADPGLQAGDQLAVEAFEQQSQ